MIKVILIFLILLLYRSFTYSQEDSVKVASQNPSPMVEYTRSHGRIAQQEFKGTNFTIGNLLSKPVDIYVPEKNPGNKKFDLLVHFHGGSNLPIRYAAEKYSKGGIITANVSLGSGSRIYYSQFEDSTLFQVLLDSIRSSVSGRINREIKFRRIILSGFSAGYGSIKRIISSQRYYNLVEGIILLDGIHASYIPDRKVIFEGGKIDSQSFNIFIKFAKDASQKKSQKKFLITHSEIFPGTFVSTTEATDYLIRELGLKRKPVLKAGPFGMQQLSEAKNNHFRIMGFAGNSGPDHIDHYHSLFYFLNLLD